MSFLGLDPVQEADLYDKAARNPFNSDHVQPGIFSGMPEAAVNGLFTGLVAKPSLLIGDAITPIIKPYTQELDNFLGTDITGAFESGHKRVTGDIREMQPNPQTVGTAGQIVNGLADVLPEAVAGFAAGGPSGAAALVASLQGYSSASVAADEGMDQYTALGKGAIDAAASGAGVLLPASVGLKLIPNLLFGVGANLSMGTASRGLTSALLDARGYHDMAEQYRPLDAQAMIVDAALGAAFGGLGHYFHPKAPIKPSSLDAVLTTNNMLHSEVDTLPGLPKDYATRDLHVESVNQALDALIEGRPVDVASILQDSHFDENPHADAVREEIASGIKEFRADPDGPSIGELLAENDKTGPDGKIDYTAGHMLEEDLAKLHPDQAEKLRQLYRDASDRKPEFDALVTKLSKDLDAIPRLTDLKGSPRAVEKTLTDNNGDASKIKDLLRGTIEVHDVEQAQRVIAAIFQHFNVLPTGQRNLLDPAVNPIDGYRDAKFNVEFQGHTAEVQVNLPELMKVKKQYHHLYTERDAIERKATQENRDKTPEELANVNRLNAEMKAAYDAAWSSLLHLTSKSNLSRETSAPLRETDSPGNLRGGSVSQAATSGTPGIEPVVTGTPSTSKNLTSGENFTSDAPFDESIAQNNADSQVLQNVKLGASTEIKIDGKYVPAHWALIEADQVAPTIDKADNQFRDRNRAASQVQIQDIASNIDFNMLSESPMMDFGAPTLAKDGRVIGGNGRVAAIDMAYGKAGGKKYRKPLMDSLQKFGLDPVAAKAMKKPMLVRILDADVDVKKAAIASNEGGGMRMSSLEQAKVDAMRLGDTSGIDIPDNGELNTPANRNFIKRWVGEFPPNQQAALIDADGYLSSEGLSRLRNAILFQAYGDSPTLSRLVESTDPGARNVANALVKAAPNVAEARGRIEEGSLHAVDIAPDLISAVEKFSQLKSEGKTIADHFAQNDIFGDNLSPEARNIMAYFEANARSGRAITDMITGFYDRLRAAGNPGQGDLLGGSVPEKSQLLESSAKSAGKDPLLSIAQQALFDRPDLQITTDTGETVSAKQALDDAGAQIQQAQRESGVFDAAVECALRG